jgi:DNA-binding CsgD family transcriptional regulator
LIECTQRESEVLVFLAHGLSNKAIALRLGISQYTVRDHVCSLMLRHGLSNRVALAIRASERPWQIGGDARQYRLTKQPPAAKTSEDKWCGQRVQLTEHPPTSVALHL